MLYVLLEIAILLLVAIVLGILVGWLLWRWRRVNLAAAEYRQLLEERQAIEDDRVRATRQRNDMEQEVLAARRDRERSMQLISDRDQELVIARDRERVLVAERDRLRAESAGGPSGSTLLGAGAAGVAVGGATFVLAEDEERPPPPPPPPPGPNAADDLTAIHGVGSELQTFLNECGYWTYRQVATLSDAEVDVLQDQLPQFPNRIRNDDWVGQARHLHYEQYGDLPNR